ncbi:MAG: sel1 repeat family protein, partial [Myxococcales bacterium]|nr:sel1 repeat family protein [Myxococcales bacterium]
MGEVGSHPAYLWGREQFERLVRGDAMAGLVEDTVAMERDMMDALWEAAAEGSGEAYRLIGDCYFALVRPIGAFEGVAPLDAVGRPWSEEASAIADDNPAVEATLRAYGEAVRLGERGALKPFAFLARFSTETVQRRVLAAIDALADPIAGELYLRGLLLHWLGDAEASFEAHRRAAEAGDPDAKFELSLCYGQGLGVPPDPEQARLWLGRAAAANHPRALYNLGAAHASAAPP